MVKDPGKTLKTSAKLNIGASARSLRGKVGAADTIDLFQIKITNRSSLDAKLTGLKADADLALLNSKGKVLLRSRNKSNKSENIQTTLESGTFYLQVFTKSRKQTAYRLSAIATPNALPAPTAPTNTAPTLVTNSLPASRGISTAIGQKNRSRLQNC
jgi:Bacterial pre-peptidase C-terminal domain